MWRQGDAMEEMQVTGLTETVERLAAAAATLEQALERMSEWQGSMEAAAGERLEKIVATVEPGLEAELMRRLEAAEATIAELRAGAATVVVSQGRKTLPASMVTMLAKQGVVMDSVEAGAVDAALTSLSIEQRIAVKSELMRAGLLG
jgi:F0F1-type ATP synthase membrane subunit b/b'